MAIIKSKRLDELTNEIEQGFMQKGGWESCRYLLGKLVCECEKGFWDTPVKDLNYDIFDQHPNLDGAGGK